MKIPDTTKIEKYAKRNFKSKRLRKKQVSVLKKTYYKISKRNKCWVVSMSMTGAVPDRELWAFQISLLGNAMDLIDRKDEIPIYKPYKNDDTPTRQYEKLAGIGMPVEQKTESA